MGFERIRVWEAIKEEEEAAMKFFFSLLLQRILEFRRYRVLFLYALGIGVSNSINRLIWAGLWAVGDFTGQPKLMMGLTRQKA